MDLGSFHGDSTITLLVKSGGGKSLVNCSRKKYEFTSKYAIKRVLRSPSNCKYIWKLIGLILPKGEITWETKLAKLNHLV